ncbi:hypothetical protein JCM19232_4954 [Vibrio ishigakensis]|uniref:AAA domain-containing protein n=1 Tax=Vibrio ishigakensis TaxID=1481914 RepID=A0A0B8PS56_9VIBR|nr:hypothetical protein JCM19232_4954 [Vibrio ishigakensis]
MTRVIGFANQKGGVGKTTVCVNFGLSMAALGKKCLFLDIDLKQLSRYACSRAY